MPHGQLIPLIFTLRQLMENTQTHFLRHEWLPIKSLRGSLFQHDESKTSLDVSTVSIQTQSGPDSSLQNTWGKLRQSQTESSSREAAPLTKMLSSLPAQRSLSLPSKLNNLCPCLGKLQGKRFAHFINLSGHMCRNACSILRTEL